MLSTLFRRSGRLILCRHVATQKDPRNEGTGLLSLCAQTSSALLADAKSNVVSSSYYSFEILLPIPDERNSIIFPVPYLDSRVTLKLLCIHYNRFKKKSKRTYNRNRNLDQALEALFFFFVVVVALAGAEALKLE